MTARVRFENPPVVEVVFGVAFATIQKFCTPYVGRLWQSLGPEFNKAEDVALLAAPSSPAQLDLSEPMPWPRVWLISKDEQNLIQVQKDRFLYNWKRSAEVGGYPTFDHIFPTFQKHFATFRSFIDRETLGKLDFRQFELTYVNHIPIASAAPVVGANATDVLVDHVRDESRARLLPEAHFYQWQTQYQLPDDAGTLFITAQSAHLRDDRELIIRLDVSVRGMPEDASVEGMNRWFDLAHDWIVQGFIDVTANAMQEQVWGRLK